MDQAWISMYNESKTMYIWGMCPTPKLMSNGEPTVHPRFSYRTKGNVDARFHIVVLYKKRKILYMWVALHVPATHAYKLFYLVTFFKK